MLVLNCNWKKIKT